MKLPQSQKGKTVYFNCPQSCSNQPSSVRVIFLNLVSQCKKTHHIARVLAIIHDLDIWKYIFNICPLCFQTQWEGHFGTFRHNLGVVNETGFTR